MDYAVLRLLHIALASVSISGFVLRWAWKIRRSPLSELRVTRILPHVVDTAFLATGIMLAAATGQFPVTSAWLTAKISGLVLYVLFGMLALRPFSAGLRVAGFVCAVATFAWIVSVARLKTPLGFLVFLSRL